MSDHDCGEDTCVCIDPEDGPIVGDDEIFAEPDEPLIESDCDEHRLEAFHLICRECDSRDAYLARRAGFVGKPFSAICPTCGVWEIVE